MTTLVGLSQEHFSAGAAILGVLCLIGMCCLVYRAWRAGRRTS